jgi:hypothetical protein
VLAFAIALLLPNVREIMHYERIMLDQAGQRGSGRGAHAWWRWQPSMSWLAICVVLLATSLLHLSDVSQFLYFQF